jgi:hypothetical protein
LFPLIAKKFEDIDGFINITENILKKEENDLYAFALSASFIIKKYWEVNRIPKKDIVVKRIVDLLLDKLEISDKNIDRITYIKTIDNLKLFYNQSVKKVFLSIATNRSLNSGVRVAAIQSLTGITDEITKDRILQVLKNESEDIIIRYAAFKSVVMSRPTVKQWNIIHSVNDSEIGNYIKTFIRNLKKSTNPNRNIILNNMTQLFEDPLLFSLKVSQNIEFTFQKATFETDMIYEKGSIIPTLLNFNVWIPDRGEFI